MKYALLTFKTKAEADAYARYREVIRQFIDTYHKFNSYDRRKILANVFGGEHKLTAEQCKAIALVIRKGNHRVADITHDIFGLTSGEPCFVPRIEAIAKVS